MKNAIAMMEPPGIWAKMCGRVMNTSPGPSEGEIPYANTAGMIARPAIRANSVSNTPVRDDVAMIFSFLLTYDAYVIMVPHPILSEKNAWPSAFSKVSAVTFEKSGLKRNSTPFELPGNKREFTAMATTRIKRRGITIFENFSIPPFIPLITTKQVKQRKSARYISGSHTLDTESVNMVVNCPWSAVVNLKVIAFTK
jgi:hypothetical protein